MLNLITETYLFECYSVCAVFGKIIEDKRRVFEILGKAFMLKSQEIEQIYALSQNGEAEYINSEADFFKYSRIKQYAKLCGIKTPDQNPAHSVVATVKGKAYAEALKARLTAVGEVSKSSVLGLLSHSANEGNVLALKILGVCQCEGLVADKNEFEGLRKLKRACEWNDICATVYYLRYAESQRTKTLARLRAMVKNSIYLPFLELAREHYKIAEGKPVGEVKLLEQAFNSGIINRETCDSKYSRVISSNVIPLKDKEKIIFSANKQLITDAQSLPLKLKDRGAEIGFEFLDLIPVRREKEISAIMRSVLNCDLRTTDSYQPLCICCDSKYLLESVVSAFLEMSNEINTVKLEVAHLNAYDLEPNGNNIFVRSCDEDRDNVFLLEFSGNINGQILNGATAFLQSEKRAQFRLNQPGVQIDMSLVLPIVFCDKENAKHLKNHCEVICMQSVNGEEKADLIGRIASEKAKLYNVKSVSLEDDAIEKLKEYSIDIIQSALDRAVRNNRVKQGEILLSTDSFSDIETWSRENKRTFGFGG